MIARILLCLFDHICKPALAIQVLQASGIKKIPSKRTGCSDKFLIINRYKISISPRISKLAHAGLLYILFRPINCGFNSYRLNHHG
jgi:hypothetical protein